MTFPAAAVPSLPCSRMRRLEAMLSESRKRVSRSSSVGKTEKSTALRTCTAERKTSTEAAIEQASNISMRKAGTGTSITKMMLMAPIGRASSLKRLIKPEPRPAEEGA